MDRRTAFGTIFGVTASSGCAALIAAYTVVSPYHFQILAGFGSGGLALGMVGLLWLAGFPAKTGSSRVRSLKFRSAAGDQPARPPMQNESGRFSSEINVPVFRLMADCAGKTAVQAGILTASNVGQELRVSGKIVAASGTEELIVVTIALDESLRHCAFLTFAEDARRLTVRNKGELITATGRVASVREFEIYLDDCQLGL